MYGDEYDPSLHGCALGIGSMSVYGKNVTIQPTHGYPGEGVYNLNLARLEPLVFDNTRIFVLTLGMTTLGRRSSSSTHGNHTHHTTHYIPVVDQWQIPVPDAMVGRVAEALPAFCNGYTTSINIILPSN